VLLKTLLYTTDIVQCVNAVVCVPLKTLVKVVLSINLKQGFAVCALNIEIGNIESTTLISTRNDSPLGLFRRVIHCGGVVLLF
jgi:hypothetical protein